MRTMNYPLISKGMLIFCIFTFTFFKAATQTPGTSKYITIDQFGYLPDSKKTAVIRDPQIGFDSLETFQPGASYAVVNKETGEKVLTGTPVKWQNGATDALVSRKL